MAQQKGVSKYLIGAGVAAAVAAGVVSFLTQTKKGKQVALKGKKYAGEIAKNVATHAEELKELTKERYEALIDDVVDEYQKQKKITKAAGKDMASELKKEWKQVKKELQK